MRKTLLLIAISSNTLAFASNNSAFQEFDNEYNIGFVLSQTNSISSSYPTAQVTQQNISIEGERLFDAGVWLDVRVDTLVSSVNNKSQGYQTGDSVGTVGRGKLGYAFVAVDQYLQITPYATIGVDNNGETSTNVFNGGKNITNDKYYNAGVGGRLEYRVNKGVFLYADQAATYNWDQSGPMNGIQPQNNMLFVSNLGAKFNVYRNLQLGLNGFYNYFQQQAAIPSLNGNQVYVPQETFGAEASIGLTY